MKKILLVSAVVAGLMTTGLVLAKDKDEIKPNIANIFKSDLKQRIQIEETLNGNMAWLTGAKITEISGTSTTTSTTTPNLIKVKVFGQDYKIDVATGTNVVRQNWGKSTMDLSEFSVGDIINVYGTLDSADYFLIHAKTLRNISIQKMHAVVNGNITNIASTTNSFTMEARKTGTTTITINTDSNTKIYAGKNLKSFSDLQVGMKVMVRGVWDTAMSKIKAFLVRMKPFEVEEEDED